MLDCVLQCNALTFDGDRGDSNGWSLFPNAVWMRSALLKRPTTLPLQGAKCGVKVEKVTSSYYNSKFVVFDSYEGELIRVDENTGGCEVELIKSDEWYVLTVEINDVDQVDGKEIMGEIYESGLYEVLPLVNNKGELVRDLRKHHARKDKNVLVWELVVLGGVSVCMKTYRDVIIKACILDKVDVGKLAFKTCEGKWERVEIGGRLNTSLSMLYTILMDDRRRKGLTGESPNIEYMKRWDRSCESESS